MDRKPPKILFVGQNPAGKSKDERAFHGTRSGKVLFGWIAKAGVPADRCYFTNVSRYKTFNNKPLTMSQLEFISVSSEFREMLADYDGVVAVGRQAQQAVRRCLGHSSRVECIEHPSGLNRNLNDPEVVLMCIDRIRSLHDRCDEEGS